VKELMGQISLDTCDRMRELFSASLDGELAELDSLRLQGHLATCGGCRAYASAAEAAARLVRETPLEQLTVPIVIPGRRYAVARKLQVAAAAAAVTATVGLSVAVGTISGPSSARAPHATPSATLRFPDQELRMLQRASQARTHPQLAL
jgi:predicted anti-sigma-YlaC factor YlaD